MEQSIHAAKQHAPWNKGKLVGQKAPLKLKDIWAIRVRLQIGERTRELALFNLAIDSQLRPCDLVKLRVRDVCHGSLVAARAMVMQQKTQRPVQFEITEQTRGLSWQNRRRYKSRRRLASAQCGRQRPGAASQHNSELVSRPAVRLRSSRMAQAPQAGGASQPGPSSCLRAALTSRVKLAPSPFDFFR